MFKYHATIMAFYDEIAVVEVWADTAEKAIQIVESTMCEYHDYVGYIQQM